MKLHALAIGGLLACAAPAHSGCCTHHTEEAALTSAEAVAEYRILDREYVTDDADRILTEYRAELNSTIKGGPPAEFSFRTPGGRKGKIEERSSLSLELKEGEDYIFFLRKADDGNWSPLPFQTRVNRGTAGEKKALRNYFRGGAHGKMPVAETTTATGQNSANSGIPGSVVTDTGYSEDASGYPARFTDCDGGLPIPYLVDIDPAKLPPGMTTQGALDAVSEALGSWSSASSLKFRFAGTQAFGVAANSINTADRTIRIQLHDTYGQTSDPVLGIGGGRFNANPDMRTGGQLGTQEFQERINGFVVLEHDAAFMDNIANFKQVLTHELGHALGLAHSSENPTEPEPILKNATMYYQASNDGRGAAITIYDEDRINFGYPEVNSPPYLADRFMHAVSDSGTGDLPNALGVNRIDVSGVDLQGDTLTPILVSASDPAAWSLAGSSLAYSPPGSVSAAGLTDTQIANGSYYSFAYVQISDGVNKSRIGWCRVIQIWSDSRPTDGLPSSWMTTNFGTINAGAAGSPSDPLSDPDSDGLTNRQEFNLQTNPNSAASPGTLLGYDHATRILTLNPLRYASFQIQASSSTSGWSNRALYSTSNAPAPVTFGTVQDTASSRKFYRVVPVP